MEVIFIILFILLVNTFIIRTISSRYSVASENYLWVLFIVHYLLTIAYLVYSSSSRSDSQNYYYTTFNVNDWLTLFQTGTKFVGFVLWPFSNVLELSYFSNMIIFSYFGYLGAVFFYVTAKENIQLRNNWKNYSPIELLFLLPNLHFWTSSIGKGSIISLGIGLLAFGLSRFNKRILSIIIASFLVYMIRPHIFFAIVAASILGLLFTRIGIKPIFKWLFIVLSAGVFIYISGDVLRFADSDSIDVTSSSSISHRASQLSSANSGVDIQNYNLLYKIFTFWFRPLFFDGLGAMGFICSFENLLCLILFIIAIKEGFKNWSKWNGLFKIFVFAFLIGSFILCQVTGNLGIAMRQKVQFMPFFFIIYCKAISYRQKELS